MRDIFRYFLFSSIFLLLVVREASAEPTNQPEPELIEYVVKKGDTCSGIASRELGARKAYKMIHKYNRLGPVPHRLKPGMILRLPKVVLQPDAKLSTRVGKVQYRKATDTLWDLADSGLGLFRAWRVWSHDEATAVVTFRDQSVVSMRSNSVLVIYGPTVPAPKRNIVKARLESGGLRTRLAALENRLMVETDSSVIELEKGTAVLAVSEKKTATISNHGGRKIAVRGRKRKSRAVSVATGKGTWVDTGKAPAPPRDLPPVPKLRPIPPTSLGLASVGVTIVGRWAPVPQAKRYRVEIAIDPNVRIVVAAFEVESNITSFEARGLAARDYYISVASIDDKGLESMPSARTKVTGVTLAATGPQGEEHAAPSKKQSEAQGEAAVPTLALGTVLTVPKGSLCAKKQLPLSKESIRLTTPGTWWIECRGEDGSVAELSFEVPDVQFSIAGDAETPTVLRREEEQLVTIRSKAPFPENANIRMVGGENVEAELVSMATDAMRIRIRTKAGIGDFANLEIHQDTVGGDIVLGTIRFPVAPQQEAVTKGKSALHMAGMLGFFETRLEDDSNGYEEIPFAGLRLSWQFSQHLELEGQTRLAKTTTGTKFWLASNELSLVARQDLGLWVLRGRFGGALWHNAHPSETTTRVGIGSSLSVARTLGSGAVRMDLDWFALAEVHNRLGVSLSYGWDIH